jgi:hypothetical protein
VLVYAGNAPLIPAYLLSLFIQVQTAVTGEFHKSVDALCNQYQSEWEKRSDTEGFLKKIRSATQKWAESS